MAPGSTQGQVVPFQGAGAPSDQCLAFPDVERVRVVVRPGEKSPLDLAVIEDAHAVRAPIVGLAATLRAQQGQGSHPVPVPAGSRWI